jgi:hypothetical protein
MKRATDKKKAEDRKIKHLIDIFHAELMSKIHYDRDFHSSDQGTLMGIRSILRIVGNKKMWLYADKKLEEVGKRYAPQG